MTFEAAVEQVIEIEGDYSFDASDPGGETRFGICKRTYPDLNIRDLTKAEAIAIYYKDYWEPLNMLEIPDRLRLCLFDCAVNQGRGRAIKALQTAIGVPSDGVLGPITLAAAKNRNPFEVLETLLLLRLSAYTKLPHWDQFGKGWAKRLIIIAAASLK